LNILSRTQPFKNQLKVMMDYVIMPSVSYWRGPVGLLPHGMAPAMVFKYVCLLENILSVLASSLGILL